MTREEFIKEIEARGFVRQESDDDCDMYSYNMFFTRDTTKTCEQCGQVCCGEDMSVVINYEAEDKVSINSNTSSYLFDIPLSAITVDLINAVAGEPVTKNRAGKE